MQATRDTTAFVWTCDIPDCSAKHRGHGHEEQDWAWRLADEGWALVGLNDESSWQPPDTTTGAYLHLCPDHASLAPTVRLVLSLIDHRDELKSRTTVVGGW